MLTDEEWQDISEAAELHLPITQKSHKAELTLEAFAKTIDHTLLKLDATEAGIDLLCEEARREGFKSVCVRLEWVGRAVRNLKGSQVVVACVVGFHEGTMESESKAAEAKAAIEAGASELDMVINYPLLKQRKYSAVYADIAAVRVVALYPTIVKAIIETSQLTRFEIIAACKIAQGARVDFVKTSTGFNGGGATRENVRLMKDVLGGNWKVKASGGVKTIEDFIGMVEAGAERIGTSSGLAVMRQARTLLGEGLQHEKADEKECPSDLIWRT